MNQTTDNLELAEGWLDQHLDGDFDQNTLEEIRAAALLAIARELRLIRKNMEREAE